MHTHIFTHRPEDLIACGGSRCVYSHENPDWVIKVQKDDRILPNCREYFIWNNFSSRYTNFLAPIIGISKDKKKLIMIKGKEITREDFHANKMRKKIPKWIRDIKAKNFIYLNGKIICCDYGGAGTLLNLAYLENMKMELIQNLL